MINFEIQFVERTIDILENYRGPFSFSNLINCSLGLILLPYEKISTADIWEKDIAEIEFLKEVKIKTFTPIKKIKSGEKIFYKKTLYTFLRKLRNGIAHQHIVPINKNGKLYQIQIFNKYHSYIDLDLIFSEAELKKFALGISKMYLGQLSYDTEQMQ